MSCDGAEVRGACRADRRQGIPLARYAPASSDVQAGHGTPAGRWRAVLAADNLATGELPNKRTLLRMNYAVVGLYCDSFPPRATPGGCRAASGATSGRARDRVHREP